MKTQKFSISPLTLLRTLIQYEKKFALSAIILVAGVYLGLIIQKIPYLTLNPQVDVVALGNLIFVVILSILVPIFVTTRMNNSRIKKDMLIEELRYFSKSLELTSNLLEANIDKTPTKIVFTQVLGSFKKARQIFKVIDEQLDKKSSEKILVTKSELDKTLMTYWKFVTGDDGIKMNNYKVTASFFWKQSCKFDDTARVARQLIFLINNS